MMRVGMLTSGGDCQALNATMRGVAKTLYNADPDTQIFGFEEGYRGLMYNDYILMKPNDFSGILTKGGTILGSSRQPFKLMRVPGENGFNKVEAMKATYRNLKLDCLVILGGNGTQKTANLLSEEGLNIVSLPKTIDNDIYGTDMTFGFQSAVDIATNAIDCIHTTAASHGRVFIVELMGHKVGWLTLHAGIAGGADIILLPEIPYNFDAVLMAVKQRNKAGKRFSILADAYDRVVATRLGAAAGRMILEGKYGCMAAFKNNEIIPVPLKEVAGRLKTVDPKSDIIREARDMGISFGNEL